MRWFDQSLPFLLLHHHHNYNHDHHDHHNNTQHNTNTTQHNITHNTTRRQRQREKTDKEERDKETQPFSSLLHHLPAADMCVCVHAHTYTFCAHRCTCARVCMYVCMCVCVRVIVNPHGHNNIRNGIVWVQRGHSTSRCTVSLHVIELCTHQKFESFKKRFSQQRNSNSNLLINSKNHRNRSG